jgi:hypothetical protein
MYVLESVMMMMMMRRRRRRRRARNISLHHNMHTVSEANQTTCAVDTSFFFSVGIKRPGRHFAGSLGVTVPDPSKDRSAVIIKVKESKKVLRFVETSNTGTETTRREISEDFKSVQHYCDNRA